MDLLCKLDWFSFTFPIRSVDGVDDNVTRVGVMGAFHNWTSGIFIGVTDGGIWAVAEERGRWKNRIQDPITGLSISWNGSDKYALCEASGRVCDSLLERIEVAALAKAANGRATRIDLAVDMECDVTPRDFIGVRNDGHFKTSGFYTSEQGETCYVGSRSGDRMARVYRYRPPHPRSHLLRAEVEYKGEAAKAVCKRLCLENLTNVTVAAHQPFGWMHYVWLFGHMKVSSIKARSYDKSNDGRWKWLMEVAWPALQKAHVDEYIDLVALFDEWRTKNT